MSVDKRKRISHAEREETLLKWLDNHGGGFTRNSRNRFDIQDTLAEYWRTLFPNARHGGPEVNATLKRMEQKGLIHVERDNMRTPVEVLDLRPKPPAPAPVATEVPQEGLVQVVAELLQELLAAQVEIKNLLTEHTALSVKAWEAVKLREGTISHVLSDMTKQDTRRYDAVLGRFEQLHGSLTGDRDLRQNYSARLGRVERQLDALMAKAGITLKD